MAEPSGKSGNRDSPANAGQCSSTDSQERDAATWLPFLPLLPVVAQALLPVLYFLKGEGKSRGSRSVSSFQFHCAEEKLCLHFIVCVFATSHSPILSYQENG